MRSANHFDAVQITRRRTMSTVVARETKTPPADRRISQDEAPVAGASFSLVR